MAAPGECSHFIPVLTSELVSLLRTDPTVAAADREPLSLVAAGIREHYHQRLHRRLVELQTAYAPFDPDSDATTVLPVTAQRRQEQLNDLLRDFIWLLDRAHFRHLSREEIEPMLRDSSDWGIRMQVDFSAFEHCALFARGECFEERTLRSWRTLFREVTVTVPIFRRLVLILKFRAGSSLGPNVDLDHVFVKIFKDIPRADVDMLLPGAKVRLKLLDRGKLGVGLLSGLGTMAFRAMDDLIRLVQYAILPAEGVLWGLLAGVLGYGYKSYYDYHTTRQAYHLNLTQSLYFQNLDSNAGVLTRLFAEAEEQETRTTLLAYFCLWHYAGPDGFTDEELEAAMEVYLDRYATTTLLCERGDPAGKLERLGLAVRKDDRCRALSLSEAVARLPAQSNGRD